MPVSDRQHEEVLTFNPGVDAETGVCTWSVVEQGRIAGNLSKSMVLLH